MSLFEIFQYVALFYILVGLWTLARFVMGWRSLWDDQLTSDDVRLASRAAFFLLVPPAVALHELGHAAFIWLYGLEVVDWEFLGYMGWVAPSGSAGALGDFAIALAGNLVTFIVGVGTIAWAFVFPGHPVRNLLAIELGRQNLFLVLVFYPLICVTFPGDWQRIYDFSATPIASGVVAAAHAAILLIGYGVYWKRRWRPRARLLCSPVARDLAEAERRLKKEPTDLAARKRLGTLMLAAGAPRAAVDHLRFVVDAGAADAQTRLAYGTVLSELGRSEEALEHISAARERLIRPEDRRAADLMLIRAEIDSGRGPSALAHASALRASAPEDDKVFVLWARAMAATGQKEAARSEVESQLDVATEQRRHLLRQLFEELR